MEGPAGKPRPSSARSETAGGAISPRKSGLPSAAEPIAFVALALLYTWLVRPTRNDWLKGPALAFIIAIPFLSVFLHRDQLADLGLRFDNLVRSAREVAIATAVGALIVVGLGMMVGAGPRLSVSLIDDFLLYPLWGMAQQFAMQSFTYRRLRESFGGIALSAALTATLFGALHYPNLALAGTTLVGGFVWCLLYQRQPNLFTLAVSHGWLAVLLRYSWPAEWLHNLRIGPGYWTWTP